MLFGFLDRAELIFLLALASCIAANYAGISGAVIGIVIAFAGLGGIYFLMAYRPPASAQPPSPEGQKTGFQQLLLLTILPKVLWISCAVGAAGLAIYYTRPYNEGFKQMLLIQSTTAVAGGLVIGLFALQGTIGAKNLIPVLYRAIPITLASVLILTS